MQDGNWVDVWFEPKQELPEKRGTLILLNDKKNDRKPEYYVHFTIEKFSEGFYRSLDYENDPVMQQFPAKVDIMPGNYLLITGNRITGGTVLADLEFFTVQPKKTVEVPIVLRKDLSPQQSYGKFPDISRLLQPGDKTAEFIYMKSGIVIAWIEPDKEPSRHFTADLIRNKNEFDQWMGSILLLFGSEPERISFLRGNIRELPKHVLTSIGSPGSVNELSYSTGKTFGQNFPLIAFIDPDGEILFLSEGYKIGTGDDLLRCIKR